MSSKTEDAKETQRFAIHNVLCAHCGEMLSADKVDQIMSEILHEMREGPCARVRARVVEQPKKVGQCFQPAPLLFFLF